MKKPTKEPTKVMKALYRVGIIHNIALNRDMTRESHDEALSDCRGGYYQWDAFLDVTGELEKTTITMSHFEDLIELVNGTAQLGGCWQLTFEGRKICEEWERWLKAEDRDLKIYKRLQKKFGANV